jgi:xanthine dehydrogenase accessory factor
MYPSDKQVLGAIRRWAKDGRRFILATEARTWGLAPRQAGAMMAISATGQVQGSVSAAALNRISLNASRAAGVTRQRPSYRGMALARRRLTAMA